LIWISIGFVALAWILDSLLDSLVFHESTVIDQIINPSNHELGIRLLFGSVFILFGIYIQLVITNFKKAEDALKKTVMVVEDEKNKTKAIIEAIVMVSSFRILITKIVYQNQIQNEIYGNRVGDTVTKRMKAGTPSVKIALLNYHSKMEKFIKHRGLFPQIKAYCISNSQDLF